LFVPRSPDPPPLLSSPPHPPEHDAVASIVQARCPFVAGRHVDGDRVARREGLLECSVEQALEIVVLFRHVPRLPNRLEQSVASRAASMTTDILDRAAFTCV